MPSLVPAREPVKTKILHSTGTKDGSKGYQWKMSVNTPTDGSPLMNLTSDEFEVSVLDIRPLPLDDFTLDTSGFQPVLDQPTSLSYEDWRNEERIKSTYYAEVDQLLKRLTGAHTTTIFDHTIRRNEHDTPDTPDTRKPVYRAHVDQTSAAVVKRVHRHDPDQADTLLQGRVRLINIWRPLRGPVQDVPLAVCDYRTIDITKDLEPVDLIYSPEVVGETLHVRYNPDHKWYYLSEMQKDELLLLKCYDSESPVEHPTQGIASLTPHTAFEDPAYKGKPDVLPRESIEIRALVYG